MHTFLCVALFALGHLDRDGFPATGETQLARGTGAVWCMAGASAVAPPLVAAAIGLLILAGFYSDQKHAEGQRARGWQDAGFLALSGVTSLLPLATVAFEFGPSWLLVLPLGLAKVPVYFVAWRLFGENENGDRVPTYSWAQPTRIAAIVFGAAVGCAVAGLA